MTDRQLLLRIYSAWLAYQSACICGDNPKADRAEAELKQLIKIIPSVTAWDSLGVIATGKRSL